MSDLSLEIEFLDTFILEEKKEELLTTLSYICESDSSNQEKTKEVLSIINKIITQKENEEFKKSLLITFTQKILENQEIFLNELDNYQEQQDLLVKVITIDIDSFYSLFSFDDISTETEQTIFNTSYQNNIELTISHLEKFKFIDQKIQTEIADSLVTNDDLLIFLHNYEKFNLIDEEVLNDLFIEAIDKNNLLISVYMLSQNDPNEVKKYENLPKQVLEKIAEIRSDFALYLLKNPKNDLLKYDNNFKNKLILNIINNNPEEIYQLIQIDNINLQKYQNVLYEKFLDLAYEHSSLLGATNLSEATKYLSFNQKKKILNILIDKYQTDPSSISINSLLIFGMDKSTFVQICTDSILKKEDLNFNVKNIPQDVFDEIVENILKNNSAALLNPELRFIWENNLELIKKIYESSIVSKYLDLDTYAFVIKTTYYLEQVESLNEQNAQIIKFIINKFPDLDKSKRKVNEYLQFLNEGGSFIDLPLYEKYLDPQTHELFQWANCDTLSLLKFFQDDELWKEALTKFEQYKKQGLIATDNRFYKIYDFLRENDIKNIKYILSFTKKGSTPDDFLFFEKALEENNINWYFAKRLLNHALDSDDPAHEINQLYKKLLQPDVPHYKKYWFIISQFLSEHLDNYEQKMQYDADIKVDLFIDEETGEITRRDKKTSFKKLTRTEQISALVALIEQSQIKSNSKKEKSKANTRNKILEHTNQLALGECFLHATNIESLEPILKTGNIAGEVVSLIPDVYPMHVDFSQVTQIEQTRKIGNFNRILTSTWSYFEWYNPDPSEEIEQIFILYNRHPFFSPNNDGLDPDFYKHENQFVLGAYPSTEISGIIIVEEDIKKDSIEKIKQQIKENGFFIPIYNENGEILFSYEEYQEY